MSDEPERIWAVIGYSGTDPLDGIPTITGAFHSRKDILYGTNVEYVRADTIEYVRADTIDELADGVDRVLVERITALTASLAAEKLNADYLGNAGKNLLRACVAAGVGDNIFAELFPDEKDRSGQDIAPQIKALRRYMNEMKAALGETK